MTDSILYNLGFHLLIAIAEEMILFIMLYILVNDFTTSKWQRKEK